MIRFKKEQEQQLQYKLSQLCLELKRALLGICISSLWKKSFFEKKQTFSVYENEIKKLIKTMKHVAHEQDGYSI